MKLLLRNLCVEVCEKELEKLFSRYGRVSNTKIIRDKENLLSRGVAIVEMENGGDDALLHLNYADYKAQLLFVSKMND